MKLYFAGSFSGVKAPRLKELGVQNKLFSYANEKNSAIEWGSNGLMLDSGAFSVFTKGIEVNIDSLIAFIKEHKPEAAIQLDVIGDDEKTWSNYRYMREHVPNVLPVIHYKASDEHIKRVVEATDYILLGGLVPLTRQKPKLFAWLDYLYANYGLRHKKIHLLGITTKTVLERYPAYSCDSSSALSINRYPASDPLIRMKQKTEHYTDLYKYGIDEMMNLETYITKLWEKRGIIWQ